MLKTRILSAAVGIPLLLLILYQGGAYWQALFVLLGFIALYEYLAMMKQANLQPLIIPAYYLMAVLIFRLHYANYVPCLLLAGLLVLVIILVVRYPQRNYLDVAATAFGASYIGFLLSFALAMADLPGAYPAIILTFLLTWSSDTGGYLFGRFWGRHKLVPRLSPNKTWEGAGGALILPVLASVLYYVVMQDNHATLSSFLLLGLTVVITAQLGDLFMSG
jgi:phosphatidate cytidylyltransferase